MENGQYFLIFGSEEGEWVTGGWRLFPHCFTEIHINFWLKFQSSLPWPFQGRTAQSLQQRQWFHFGACLIPEKLLLLSSFEQQKFEVFFSVFCPETLLFHSFIKALDTFERNFLIKKESFFCCCCLFCQTLFPEPPVPSSWLFWELGSASCPNCSKGIKRTRQGQHHPGDTGWGSCPGPATSVGCWWLAVGLITGCPCSAFPKGKGAHPCACPDFQSG